MSLWGASAGAEDKPKNLTQAEKDGVFATPGGWAKAPGGNDNPAAQEEVLVAISNLATKLGAANIMQIVLANIGSAPFDDADVLQVDVHYNERVTVDTIAIRNFTLDAALITGNTISVDVDGVTVSEVFATDSNTTLGLFAVGVAAEAGIATAAVTDGGGGSDDDREIVITDAAVLDAILANAVVTGGATQAIIVIADAGTDVKPLLTLAFAGGTPSTGDATYASGSGTHILRFLYTILTANVAAAGELTIDTSDLIDENTATMKDEDGATAGLDMTLGGSDNLTDAKAAFDASVAAVVVTA